VVDGYSVSNRFREAVLEVLKQNPGPMTVQDIFVGVKTRVPDLCDDSIPCVHKGKRYHRPEWQHKVRWALLGLRINGQIRRVGKGTYEVLPERVKAEIGKESLPKIKAGDTHDELVGILVDLGNTLGFVTKTGEATPDGVYRLDVTWKDFEAHAPIKVFEVEVGGSVDHALSSLAHAYDVWRPEALFLVISDEKDLTRAKKLVEPIVRGAFSRISNRLRLYTGAGIKELHSNLEIHKEVLKDLARR
jgi:hypothetical protein